MQRFVLLALFCLANASILQADFPNWQNYTNGLMVNDIEALGSTIWIATRGGVTKLDRETGSMQFYTKANSGLPDNDVRIVTADHNGTLWFTTMKNELVSFDGTNWQIFTEQNSGLPSGGIKTLVVNNGIVWIGCWGGGVARFDGANWMVYNSVDVDLPSDYISSLYIDQQGIVWVGTEGSGLTTFDGTNWTRFDDEGNIPFQTIASIIQEDDGSFWFGTGNYMGNGGGVAYLKDGEWSVFTAANSNLPGNFVSSMYIDDQSHIWFATNQGVASFDKNEWKAYTSASSGLPSNAISIITGDELASIWVGTRGGGAARLIGSEWQTYNPSNSALPGNSIADMETDANDMLWIAVFGSGLVQKQGTTWQSYSTANSGLPDNRIFDITLDHNGSLWCATYGGIALFDNQDWKVYTASNAPLPSATIACLAVAKNGDIWAGSYGGGVVRFDGTTWHRYTVANGLPSNYITSIAADSNNNIWIANFTDGEITGYGVVRFDGTEWKQYNDLLNPSVAEIAVDATGVVWVGTEGGIVTFEGEKRQEFTMFNSGLPDNGIRAVSVTPDGAVWFGALNGISRFNGTNWMEYTAANSGLPSNFAGKVVLHNEKTWIGTSAGIGVLSAPVTNVDETPAEPHLLPALHPVVTSHSFCITLPNGLSNFPATLHIFDLFGREVSEPIMIPGQTGVWEFPFATQLANAVYLYHIQVGTTKIVGTFLYRR